MYNQDKINKKLISILEGQTTREVQKKTGISHALIAYLRNGTYNLGLDKVCKIADAYRVSLDWLLLDQSPEDIKKLYAENAKLRKENIELKQTCKTLSKSMQVLLVDKVKV